MGQSGRWCKVCKNWGLRWDVRKLRKESEQQKALLAQHGVTTEPVVDVPLVM